MEKKKRKFSPVLIVGGVILIGLVGTFGPSIIKNFQVAATTKYGPAAALPERLKKLESMGVQLNGEEAEFSKMELISHYQDASWRKPGTSATEDTKIAEELMKSGGDLDLLAKQSQSEKESRIPTYKDFVHKQYSLATKRATSSLKAYVTEAIAQHRSEDALKALEILYAMQDAVISTPTDASLLYWFGVNTDIIPLTEDLSREHGLTGAQRARIRKLIDPEARIPHLKDLAQRTITELIVVGRHLDKLDETEKSSMDILTGGRKIPSMMSFRIGPAMESRLAEVWIDVFEDIDFEQKPEELGIAIDLKIQKRQMDGKDIESDYLVAAIPLKYELYGRMISRVLQARAVLNVALDGSYKEGIVEKEMSGHKYLVDVSQDVGNWIFGSKGVGDFGWFTNVNGFEINQGMGVRLFLAKNTNLD